MKALKEKEQQIYEAFTIEHNEINKCRVKIEHHQVMIGLLEEKLREVQQQIRNLAKHGNIEGDIKLKINRV